MPGAFGNIGRMVNLSVWAIGTVFCFYCPKKMKIYKKSSVLLPNLILFGHRCHQNVCYCPTLGLQLLKNSRIAQLHQLVGFFLLANQESYHACACQSHNGDCNRCDCEADVGGVATLNKIKSAGTAFNQFVNGLSL